MNEERKLEKRRPEAGAALLIAIFALLLISVVAIALIVSQGTDSALTGNYRTSTSAYYAGNAGLEEGRGRLLWKNANYLNISNSFPALFSLGGAPNFGLTQVLYILNPANSETVDPTSANPAQYPDNEYQAEFGWALSGANVQFVNSVSPVAGLPGPLYKWVRITPATEQSLGIDVDWNGYIDNATPLNYDPAHQAANGTLQAGLIVGSSSTSGQALEVTALAVLPNNTQKLVQYLVAPLYYGLNNPGPNFPGVLALSGSATAAPGVSFQVPTTASTPPFQINGYDGSGPLSAAPNCTPAASPTWAIGVTDTYASPINYDTVKAAIVTAVQGNYTGEAPTHHHHTSSLSIEDDISLNPVMMTPANLNEMVQTISQNADLVLNKNATDSDMPAAMSAANTMTVVVNGNLTLTNFTGYGLLVVTGNFVSNPNAGWRGMVLVVGAGNVTFTGGSGGNGEYDGGIFVAQTLNTTPPYAPLTTIGTANFDASNAGGNGIFYNSCWINTALQPPSFQVLSFHEIPTN
jgi:hypothetical protein